MKRITKIEKRYSMLTKLKHKSFISGYFQHPKVNRLMVSQPTAAIWLKDQPDYDDVFIKKRCFWFMSASIWAFMALRVDKFQKEELNKHISHIEIQQIY